MRILWRYVAFEYLKALAGTLLALVVIDVVIDYVDHAKRYGGDDWLRWVLELYGYKSLTILYELLPGAMLLAAGIAFAGLRRRGEFTALRALAVGPAHLFAPLAVAAALVSGAVVVLDEYVVGQASRRVDEININRFNYTGSWALFFGEVRWFRGRKHIYHLRQGSAEEGFTGATLLKLSEDFRLAERVDAERMEPLGGSVWRLRNGTVRTLSGNESRMERFAERTVTLDEDPQAFHIIKGRPEQLSFKELREQIDLRGNVGLPVARWHLSLHNKFAYPFAGVPGAILGAALPLRPGRRGYLTSALAEGFGSIVAFWAVLVVLKAAALSGLVGPAVAAWAPVVLLGAVAGLCARGFTR